MAEINFQLNLISDAEPGCGFGTELINSLVPRDHNELPFFPASHIKGLMLDNLLRIAKDLSDDSLTKLIRKVFGSPGGIKEKNAGIFSVSDAYAEYGAKTILVTRTSLNANGIASDTSLRTTEAVATGTVFQGSIRIHGEPAPYVDILLKLALLSLNAIGGSRNRGCGACKVTIDGEQRTPGLLLQELLLSAYKTDAQLVVINSIQQPTGNQDKLTILKLEFEAKGPICLPETPIVGNNSIQSGFTIPASAVQGMVLHRINSYNSKVADACFASAQFRAWPLHPVVSGSSGLPVRASKTHLISKLKNEKGFHDFGDQIIVTKNMKRMLHQSPLKSADGVLAQTETGVKLLKADDIQRTITAHGVHNDPITGRNLYTIESIAPTSFVGFVALPETAAEIFLNSLAQDNFVQFGKAKSVRGGGILKSEFTSLDNLLTQKGLPVELHNRVFITQSPILIADDWQISSAKEVLVKLVEKAGWGEVDTAACTVSILFGWNSHGKGAKHLANNNRLRAQRVITPGSVFRLKNALINCYDHLLVGIGNGKKQGFGAVLPHPGVANSRDEGKLQTKSLESSTMAGKLGFELWDKSINSGLSSSQISFFRNKLCAGKDVGLNYLAEVKDKRTAKTWDRWKDIREALISSINKNYETTRVAVKVWQDLVVAKEGINE